MITASGGSVETVFLFNIINSFGMKELEMEEMITFMERQRYQKRYGQTSPNEASLDTELLQALVEMNDFTTDSVQLTENGADSACLAGKIKEIQLEHGQYQEQDPDEKKCEDQEQKWTTTSATKDLNIRKTFRGIHQFSSDVYSRLKKGIRSHVKRKQDYDECTCYEEHDYKEDNNSSGLTPEYQAQWQWHYPQMQSALMTYSTVLSGNDTVVHNNSFAFPTVESSRLRGKPSTINVLRLIDIP